MLSHKILCPCNYCFIIVRTNPLKSKVDMWKFMSTGIFSSTVRYICESESCGKISYHKIIITNGEYVSGIKGFI